MTCLAVNVASVSSGGVHALTMDECIKGVHPVSTGLVVQALARPEWLVEIDKTTVIPDES